MKKFVSKKWRHLVRLQFWSILYFETLAVGIVLLAIDWMYDDHLPSMLNSFDFPYFGFIMTAIGLYSFISIFKSINLFSILANASIWMYITLACIEDLTNPIRLIPGLSIVLGVVSLCLCIRITAESKLLDLNHEKKRKRERDNGELD